MYECLKVLWTKSALDEWQKCNPRASTQDLIECVRTARRAWKRELRSLLSGKNAKWRDARLIVGQSNGSWWAFALKDVEDGTLGVRVLAVLNANKKVEPTLRGRARVRQAKQDRVGQLKPLLESGASLQEAATAVGISLNHARQLANGGGLIVPRTYYNKSFLVEKIGELLARGLSRGEIATDLGRRAYYIGEIIKAHYPEHHKDGRLRDTPSDRVKAYRDHLARRSEQRAEAVKDRQDRASHQSEQRAQRAWSILEMLENGSTQGEVARQLGVTPQRISQIALRYGVRRRTRRKNEQTRTTISSSQKKVRGG